MIPESFIQELLGRVDIVDVVERYISLRKAGANYSACCPFHSEKTPSFTVSPSKQFYHCFGCGAHGSAIGFVMQYAGLGFIDAVEELARNAGMQVPQVSDRIQSDRAKKAPLTELMARAARFYKDQLKASPKAIDYLKGRGLTGEVAARFGLGYAPDEWQGLQQVFPDY
ncbi:partial DNA primase, partial [Rhodocyclaceae bacterium]